MENIVEKTVVEPYGFIYMTTNMVNGKKYLGQRRFSDGWKNYLGSGNIFRKALKMYGKENFIRNIICVCYSEEELDDTEYQISVFLDVVESDDYYNLVYGGGTSRGWHPSQETKDKIGAKAKERFANPENHPMYGRPGKFGEENPMFGISPKERMDEDTYQQWYEKHIKYWETNPFKGRKLWEDKKHPCLGKKLSEERKELISKKAKERYKDVEKCPFYGRHHTEESRKKMSDKRKDGQMYCCQPIYCTELDQYFYAASEAEKILNIDSSTIRKCCNGKRKSAGKHSVTGKPLHWKDVTKEEYEQHINNESISKGEMAENGETI